jgi:hypothetical protein
MVEDRWPRRRFLGGFRRGERTLAFVKKTLNCLQELVVPNADCWFRESDESKPTARRTVDGMGPPELAGMSSFWGRADSSLLGLFLGEVCSILLTPGFAWCRLEVYRVSVRFQDTGLGVSLDGRDSPRRISRPSAHYGPEPTSRGA